MEAFINAGPWAWCVAFVAASLWLLVWFVRERFWNA